MSMIKKCIALFLLLLMVTALALAAWTSIRAWTRGSESPLVIASPYVYKFQYEELDRGDEQVRVLVGCIQDMEMKKSASLYPYGHLNAVCRIPPVREGTGSYTFRNVQYEFQVVEDTFQITATRFYAAERWRELSEEGGTVYEKQVNGHWPFQGRSEIVELPEESGFYDPIAIPGLGGCGLLLLSSDDPGVEADISVYISTDEGWSQAEFRMPDGTRQALLRGYVRRQADPTVMGSVSKIAGNMEVCVKNQSGRHALYNVVYSEGMLALEETQAEVTAENLRGWMY